MPFRFLPYNDVDVMDDARFDRVVNALQLDEEDMIIIVERSATTPALEAFSLQTMV